MPDMNDFDRWARRACAEVPPQPDVAPAVMQSLRGLKRRPEPVGLMWLLSGAAACAAALCAAVGYRAWLALDSPLRTWVEDLSEWGIL